MTSKKQKSDISYRLYKDDDKQKILELAFKEHGDGEFTNSEFFDWIYLKNPAGKAIISCACDGDTVVGMVANIPMPFTGPQGAFSIVQSINVLTDPDYRGLGIFKQCGLMAGDAALDQGYAYVLGFPNSAAFPGWQRMGHSAIGLPQILAYVVSPTSIIAHISSLNVLKMSFVDRAWRFIRGGQRGRTERVHTLTSFAGVTLPLTQTSPQHSLVRTPEWLEWRYLQVPTRDYTILAVGDPHAPAALAVVREKVGTSGKTRGLKLTYLLDLIITEAARPADVTDLLTAVLAHAASVQSVGVLAMASPNGPFDAQLRAAKYMPVPAKIGWDLPIIVRAKPGDSPPHSVGQIDVRFGVTDSF